MLIPMARIVAFAALLALTGSPVLALYCNDLRPQARACCTEAPAKCGAAGISDDCCRRAPSQTQDGDVGRQPDGPPPSHAPEPMLAPAPLATVAPSDRFASADGSTAHLLEDRPPPLTPVLRL